MSDPNNHDTDTDDTDTDGTDADTENPYAGDLDSTDDDSVYGPPPRENTTTDDAAPGDDTDPDADPGVPQVTLETPPSTGTAAGDALHDHNAAWTDTALRDDDAAATRARRDQRDHDTIPPAYADTTADAGAPPLSAAPKLLLDTAHDVTRDDARSVEAAWDAAATAHAAAELLGDRDPDRDAERVVGPVAAAEGGDDAAVLVYDARRDFWSEVLDRADFPARDDETLADAAAGEVSHGDLIARVEAIHDAVAERALRADPAKNADADHPADKWDDRLFIAVPAPY